VKGIILAGGHGTRLYPMTKVINKHLLNVYDKPMIYYPIQTLVDAGIDQIMVVTGGNNAGSFLELLGNGEEFGLEEMHYAYQKGAGGIADALSLARSFIGDDKFVVMLGDNILENSIKPYVDNFVRQKSGAKILLKEVDDPQRFGVASIDKNKNVSKIVEKPEHTDSSYAVIGVYMYDGNVFDIIKRQRASKRGEMEITDVNNAYIKRGELTSDVVDGWWTDAGTVESLFKANLLLGEKNE
jgi:glucose-1-phosphate thymidylyltransferase